MVGESANKDDRMWAMFCHLGGLAAFTGIPFASIIAPLIIWLLKRDTSPYVDEHGKEALNFQISIAIYGIVVFVLCFVIIGFLLIPVLFIADLVFMIMAAVKANDGQSYRYPATIRLVK
jgi:hypothetical protein